MPGQDYSCFNPRPPKRTLCPSRQRCSRAHPDVSIHVLRRGRCVFVRVVRKMTIGPVSIHVLRRGRCVILATAYDILAPVVSIHVLRRGRCVCSVDVAGIAPIKFQSTSSEEDVVSNTRHGILLKMCCFNPRPPKRTLCLDCLEKCICIDPVSIHVLRRGRCVILRT